MRQARTKEDLIIEVWEELDCENVGAAELEAIEDAVRERFGPAAVDSPMVLARLLADEGAELRHSEIMKLYLERNADRPYDPAFRNLMQLNSLAHAVMTIKNLENLRRKFAADEDKEGLRLLRELVLQSKKGLSAAPREAGSAGRSPSVSAEISRWLAIWLQTPEIFADWLELRRKSPDYTASFEQDDPELGS